LLDERGLCVRAALLGHGTPCLAFALQEGTHVNIWKTGLAELGLPTGPWLQELKRAVLAQAPDTTLIRAAWHDRDGPHERSVALGELKARVVQLVRGQKVCYVTDVAFTPQNGERILALASGADILYIEATFAQEDAARAADRYHLTTRQAGELARRAGAQLAIPFHFSPRYLEREAELRAQFEAAFRGAEPAPAAPSP
jgi:ribonuclease Z